MSKKVVVISSSLRSGSNSEVLAQAFVQGAQAAGNIVEEISLKEKDLRFCTGFWLVKALPVAGCRMIAPRSMPN